MSLQLHIVKDRKATFTLRALTCVKKTHVDVQRRISMSVAACQCRMLDWCNIYRYYVNVIQHGRRHHLRHQKVGRQTGRICSTV